ncbi:MAG: hypothetical protein QW331_04495 [Candidatus Woesearchaeota archaeon]
MKIIGFRQYLKTDKSYGDFLKIIFETESLFNSDKDVRFISAICGDNPKKFLKKNLIKNAQLIEAISSEYKVCAAKTIKKLDLKKKVILIYYGAQKLGLTFPMALLCEVASRLNAKILGISDSDFQIPYSAIKRSFFDAKEKICNNKKATLYLPFRSHRSLELQNYPINRFAVEDIENAYYRIVTNDRSKENLDLQSGLCFLNKSAIKLLDFSNVPRWTGNINIAVQIKKKGNVVKGITIDTNPQNESTISPDVQFKKINELENSYGYKLLEAIGFVLKNPDFLMSDWKSNKSKKEIAEILNEIVIGYEKYKKSRKA